MSLVPKKKNQEGKKTSPFLFSFISCQRLDLCEAIWSDVFLAHFFVRFRIFFSFSFFKVELTKRRWDTQSLGNFPGLSFQVAQQRILGDFVLQQIDVSQLLRFKIQNSFCPSLSICTYGALTLKCSCLHGIKKRLNGQLPPRYETLILYISTKLSLQY